MSEMGGFAKSIIYISAAILTPLLTFMFYAHSIQRIYLKSESEFSDIQHNKYHKGRRMYFSNNQNIPKRLKGDEEFL